MPCPSDTEPTRGPHGFTADLLFAGQSQEFFDTVMALAEATDAAQRGF